MLLSTGPHMHNTKPPHLEHKINWSLLLTFHSFSACMTSHYRVWGHKLKYVRKKERKRLFIDVFVDTKKPHAVKNELVINH